MTPTTPLSHGTTYISTMHNTLDLPLSVSHVIIAMFEKSVKPVIPPPFDYVSTGIRNSPSHIALQLRHTASPTTLISSVHPQQVCYPNIYEIFMQAVKQALQVVYEDYDRVGTIIV